jgi:hypothetical protein
MASLIRPRGAWAEWLFRKMLGAIYAIAFLSLYLQIAGLIGSRGILPLRLYLARISEAFGAGRYWSFPTVFWIASSDFALKAVCAAGVAFSILLMAGYAERVALIVCWALYLSLTVAGQDFMSFQWDILLLETGFLAIFLGFSPVIVWLYRWLLFRLVLLSGAVKLLSGDPAWRTLAALKFHYETQPLPTPVAWYMHQLPGWFQEASAAMMFGIELGAPLLIFAPRRLRLGAAIAIVFLQILILLTGNYTYFNLLTIALCLFLASDPQPATSRSRYYIAIAVAAILIPISAGELIAQFLGPMPAPLRYVQRLFAPLNLTSTYGLFAVMTTTRREIVVEGSNDGSSWREYEFRYKPGDVYRPPPWVAPHQPRLDWQMWFAALSSYQSNPWFVNFIVRLLEGSPEVLALLDRNPFPGAPPRYIRAPIYDYTFTDWKIRRATGAWWRREPRGIYLPPVSLQDSSGR